MLQLVCLQVNFLKPNRLFAATRGAALERLRAFAPRAGRAYAEGRNTDPGAEQPGAVSKLSPYLRYRLVTEREVVAEVLASHGFDEAEKFIQEVLWRSYWKGWLEMRPGVWRRFLAERDGDQERLHGAPTVREAEEGRTGIDCFDNWVQELVQTGYLHNHARMWFASIWIFTLRLPWTLGADFFLRHLIDADPASNTLSWRWVAGLQTPGKIYLATPDNIARYTNGRFAPRGLAVSASALVESPLEKPVPLAPLTAIDRSLPSILLATHEDLHPESAIGDDPAFLSAVVAADPALLWGEGARQFVSSAAADAATRIAGHFRCEASLARTLDAAAIAAVALPAGARQVVTLHAPTGPVADALTRLERELARHDIRLAILRRSWDDACWPHARKGFFAFKEHIPKILGEELRA